MPKLTELKVEMSCNHPLPLTQETIGLFDWSSQDGTHPDRPLGHLEDLDMCCVNPGIRGFPVLIHPSIKKLTLYNKRYLQKIQLPRSLSTTALPVLRLKHSDVDRRQLTKAIESSRLGNLKTLFVDNDGIDNRDLYRTITWYSFNYRRLKQAMLNHTPQLESFGWMDMISDLSTNGSTPFGSFAGFKCLKILALDTDRFIELN
jgi:hypothetical protein